MSNVQLSSSTLERLAARRTFPLHARTGACRNLFGPVDHEELNREMKLQLREISERDQRRWNFNFEADTPLSGDYQWEETPVESSPVFYQDSVQSGRRRVTVPVIVNPCSDVTPADCTTQDVRTPRPVDERLSSPEATMPRSSEVNQENCSDKLNSGKHNRKTIVCVRRKRTTTTDLTTTTATHITDFYMKRKRIRTDSTETNSLKRYFALRDSEDHFLLLPARGGRWTRRERERSTYGRPLRGVPVRIACRLSGLWVAREYSPKDLYSDKCSKLVALYAVT
ncbi:hypothetical protein AAFF_G00282380 [Aldrovandia affinis]|uniref:Cyclin-dependent kinase inhibitor 1C n=1 Tax=Aldrovandia affinis TaxID=143900 RepID=A0AAD7X0Y3_9TELE|nr:hypothetical protein AAFF_G00282380 [Aldrovandia affinis]